LLSLSLPSLFTLLPLSARRPAARRRAPGSGGPARRPAAVRGVQWRLRPRAQRHLRSALAGLALGISLRCDVLVAVHGQPGGHLLQAARSSSWLMRARGRKKVSVLFCAGNFQKKAPTHLPAPPRRPLTLDTWHY
jgi:hypothetical protein